MTINKLLLGVVMIGMLACYGCHEEPEPEEMLVCSDADAPIKVEGKTTFKTTRESVTETNTVTGAFLLGLANGVLDGEYFDPGDNKIELKLMGDGTGWQTWYDDSITIYGGSGNIDTVAFVTTPAKNYTIQSWLQDVWFYKDTTSGIGFGSLEIAYNSFTETVNPGDYCIVAWIIDFDVTQPLIGGFYLTDTVSYTLAEGLAQNTGIPYLHKLRFIYRGAVNDTNLISPYKDSTWNSSDTMEVKVFVWASDTARDGVANDSIIFIDMLDSYGRLWKRDSIMQPVQAGQYVTGRPGLYWERDPEIL